MSKQIVQKWVRDVKKEKLHVDRNAAQQLLERLDPRDQDGITYFFEEIKKIGVKPTPVMYQYVMKEHKDDLRKLEWWMEQLTKEGLVGNYAIYGLLINAAAEVGEVEKVEQLMKEIKRGGMKSNVIMFNTILQRYIARDVDMEIILKVMDEMRNEHVAPNDKTFEAVVMYAAKKREKKLVEKWMKMWDTEESPKPLFFFNDAIGQVAKQGDKEEIAYWMEEMKKNGLKANYATYTKLITGLAECGLKEEAKERVGEMREAGCNLPMPVYNEMLKTCLKEENTGDAIFWLTEMRKDKMVPDEGMIAQLRELVAKAKTKEEGKQNE